jgi:hypothetical protein
MLAHWRRSNGDGDCSRDTFITVAIVLAIYVVINAWAYPAQPGCDAIGCGIGDAWRWAFVPVAPTGTWRQGQFMYQGFYGQMLVAAAIVFLGLAVLGAAALVASAIKGEADEARSPRRRARPAYTTSPGERPATAE